MSDNNNQKDDWDDNDDASDDDDWDVSEDDLEQRLGQLTASHQKTDNFQDEEDLALREREAAERSNLETLKKKGTALAQKKATEQARLEEIEIARKAMELEAELEANLSPEEFKALKRRQVEEADHALTDDLFGAAAAAAKGGGGTKTAAAAAATGSGASLVLTDVKDHLKHARTVATAMKQHGKIHLATSLIRELLEQSKALLDDAAITDIIKTCNVIKNEKVQAAKKKSKGQAQKAKKVDKSAEAKARQIQVETFGDNDQYDDYDQLGHDYEDAFF